MSFKKTLLIIPYFGKLPEYLNLYFKGCEKNTWLHVLIITDDEIPDSKPTNVYFQQESLINFSKKIADIHKLKNYQLPNAYKLCDWRPSYGLIFHEEIKNYDYWAYGDLDVLYGDMQSYILNKHELDVDFISFRYEYLSGSLTIIKNNIFNNNLFLKIKNYLPEARKASYQALDEIKNRWDVMRSSLNDNQSFSEVVYNSHLKGEIKVSLENSICENLHERGYLIYVNNKLILDNKEVMYFHFICNKGNYYFKFPNWKSVPSEFLIIDTGFYKKRYVTKFNSALKFYRSIPHYFFKIIAKIYKN